MKKISASVLAVFSVFFLAKTSLAVESGKPYLRVTGKVESINAAPGFQAHMDTLISVGTRMRLSFQADASNAEEIDLFPDTNIGLFPNPVHEVQFSLLQSSQNSLQPKITNLFFERTLAWGEPNFTGNTTHSAVAVHRTEGLYSMDAYLQELNPDTENWSGTNSFSYYFINYEENMVHIYALDKVELRLKLKENATFSNDKPNFQVNGYQIVNDDFEQWENFLLAADISKVRQHNKVDLENSKIVAIFKSNTAAPIEMECAVLLVESAHKGDN